MPRGAILAVTLILPALVLSAAAQEAAKERRYADGPLVAEDFHMEPPKPFPTATGGVRLQATTYTELRFQYNYRYESAGAKFTAKATSVEFYSILLPDKSWNARPQDARLLDHEQGHFDLTELHARRAQTRIEKLLAEGVYHGAGASEAEARDKMLEGLNRDFQRHLTEMKDEQGVYDKDTRHGTDREKQGQWRRKITEQLETSAAERKAAALKKVPEKK
jgi:hypothetical protein